MKQLDPANCSLLELVYAQTRSLRKSAQVVAFVLAWQKTAERLGRAPSIEEYAEDWNQSRATAFREQARFREAFPKLDDPAPIIERMGDSARIDATGLPV